MTRILLLGMVDSPHVARFLEAEISKNNFLDILFIPSTPHFRINKKIINLIRAQAHNHPKYRLQIHSRLRFLSIPLWIFDRWPKNKFAIRGFLIRRAIQRFQPHIIHAMETQSAGYQLEVALRKIQDVGKVKIVLSLFGSDLFWFSRIKNHAKRLNRVLKLVDYIAGECQRDKEIALDLGFRGRFLEFSPIGVGLPLEKIRPPDNPLDIKKRTFIAVKGYGKTWGLGKLAIRALASLSDELDNFTVVIYSCDAATRRIARKLLARQGVQVKIFRKKALNHDQMLKLFSQSRISIGLSRSDGLPSTVLEAMSQGCFPIQTNTACVEGWIENGINGFLVGEVVPSKLANLIKSTLNDLSLLSRAQESNYFIIQEKYSLQKSPNNRHSFYTRLVGDSS